MSEQQGGASTSSAVVRAEQLLDRVEQSMKSFFASAGQRVQDTATSLQQKANQTIQSSTPSQEQPDSPTTPHNEETGLPVMGRAKEVVGDTRQRFGTWISVAGLQMQPIMAGVRENTRDFWTEAQSIRHSRARR